MNIEIVPEKLILYMILYNSNIMFIVKVLLNSNIDCKKRHVPHHVIRIQLYYDSTREQSMAINGCNLFEASLYFRGRQKVEVVTSVG